MFNSSNETVCHNCSGNIFLLGGLDVFKLCVCSMVAAITVFGNILVILAIFKTSSLRCSMTSYFIASLALADLIVGLFVIPFQIQFAAHNYRWLLGPALCDLWHSVDVLASTSSIWNLCIISLDRYLAVSDPFAYKNYMSFRRVCLAVAAVWVTSAIISFPAILWWHYDSATSYSNSHEEQCQFTDSLAYLCFSSLVSFYVPLTVMLVCYWRVFRAANAYETALRQDCEKHGVVKEKRVKTKAGSVRIRMHRGGGGASSGTKQELLTPVEKRRKSAGMTKYGSLPADMHVSSAINYQRGNSTPASTSACASPRGSGPMDAASAHDFNVILTPLTQKAVINQSKMQQQKRQETRLFFYNKLQQFTKEKKAAKTLGVVVGCFILCWLPFFTLNVLSGLCQGCVQSEATLTILFTWFGYINSSLNPILYAFCSRDYRKAFKRLLCSACGKQGKDYPYTTSSVSKPNAVISGTQKRVDSVVSLHKNDVKKFSLSSGEDETAARI